MEEIFLFSFRIWYSYCINGGLSDPVGQFGKDDYIHKTGPLSSQGYPDIFQGFQP
jgi:hypothetical protein